MKAQPIFETRHSAAPVVPKDAAAYHCYVVSRNRYRGTLLNELTTLAKTSGGPILEMSGGYGTIGQDVSSRSSIPVLIACPPDTARELRVRPHDKTGARYIEDAEAESLAPFPLVVSINYLHRSSNASSLLTRLSRLAGIGGTVIVNDVRRDAEPFIVEWVLRDLAKDTSPRGLFASQCFVAALRSAFTIQEIGRIAEDTGLADVVVTPDGPMTATLRFQGTR